MSLLSMLIIGLIAGALAKLLVPGDQGGGIIVTMLLGIAGAFLAGFIGKALGFYSEAGAGPGLIGSIVGAVIVLLAYGMFVGKGRART